MLAWYMLWLCDVLAVGVTAMQWLLCIACLQCGLSCHKKCLSSLQLKCGNSRNFLSSAASCDTEALRSLLCVIAQCIGEINERGISVKVWPFHLLIVFV